MLVLWTKRWRIREHKKQFTNLLPHSSTFRLVYIIDQLMVIISSKFEVLLFYVQLWLQLVFSLIQ